MTVLASHPLTLDLAPPTEGCATVAYVRLTREESLTKGLSAPGQERACRDYAGRAMLGPIEILSEPDAVGGDIPFERRKKGRLLIEGIKAGRIKHVVVRELDRLVRDVGLWTQLRELCLKHAVTIHTLSGPFSFDSPVDEFLALLRAGTAQLERKQTGDRVRHAKRVLAESGKHTGGPPPFGLISQARHLSDLVRAGMTRDEATIKAAERYPIRGHLYIDEKEAEIVRLIFHWYVVNGWGCRRISNELDARGYRRRSGKPWHADKTRRIVNDPVLAGFICSDAKRFATRGREHTPRQLQDLHKGRHEAIVPEETWRRAQVIKKSNTSTTTGSGDSSYAARQYALVGVAICGLCGSPMSGKSAARGKKFGYLVCRRRRDHGADAVQGCRCPQLNTGILETAFWAVLSKILQSPALADRVTESATRMNRNAEAERRRVSTGDREAADVRRQLHAASQRLADADPDSPDEVTATALIGQLKRRLRALQTPTPETTDVVPAADVRVDRARVESHLAALGDLVRNGASDAGKALVRSLGEHHDLRVVVVDAKTLRVSLRLRPPGAGTDNAAAEAYTVDIDETATLPKDRITAQVDEMIANAPLCSCGCGKPVKVRRKHVWVGLPSFRPECRCRAASNRRWAKVKDVYTGQRVATLLGIGRSSVNRWVESGRLPQPQRDNAGLLIFDRDAIDALVGERAASSSPPSAGASARRS